MHELFHRAQGGLGLAKELPRLPPGSGENAHLDSLEGRYWMRLEWRALARAVNASGAARTTAIADALAFRRERHQRFPLAALDEHVDELNEGMATYTQYVTAWDSAQDAIRYAVSALDADAAGASLVQTLAYTSGAGYGCCSTR